jgi:FKBP-type peptidyl-prolyl cis-trans isomerase (trigger factor)
MDEKGLDEYLKSIQRSAEQLREELRPVAVKMVKQTLVMTELARAEGIEVNVDDVKAEIETMTKDVAKDRLEMITQILTAPQSQVNIASALATRKTLARLADIAQGLAPLPEKKDKAESAPQLESAEKKESEAKQ